MSSVVEQWYEDVLRGLLARRDTLPHALLLTGPAGIGKAMFSATLTKALLCQRPSETHLYCGECQSCQLLAAGTHPDCYPVSLEGSGTDKQAKEIKVDQIRQLCQSLAQTSQLGGHKLAIIDPADTLNRNAANSLLKTLEEPTADTLLILVTASPAALLPTIRSRCQRLSLQPPGREEVLAWLQAEYASAQPGALLALAEGAPFRAAALADSGALERRAALFQAFRDIAGKRQDPVQHAAKQGKELSADSFIWMLSWVQDLICLGSNAPNSALLNADLEKDLQALATRIDLQNLFSFYDRVQQALGMLRSSVSVQLLFESLLLDWFEATGARQ